MVESWPDLAPMMLDEEGELSRRVHVFVDGRIVESGEAALADAIEEAGYDEYRTEVPAS
jgi:Fe-S cluster assembly ATPase SufC